MTPPERTRSAARRMRRSCGSTGCNFKYSAKTWSPWKLRAARDNIRGRLPRIPSTQGPSRTAPTQALTVGAALEERLRVSATLWRRLNLWSAAFYAALGALNLAVAHYASERAWVNFKMFGLTLLTFLFVALQMLWLSTRPDPLGAEPGAPHG